MPKITYCPPIHECDACKELISSKCIKWDTNPPSGGVCVVPQACVKLKILDQPTSSYSFYSCSATAAGCTKRYKVFSFDNTQVFTSTSLDEITAFVTNNNPFGPDGWTPLTTSTPYYLVEIIECKDCGETESLNLCFQVIDIGEIQIRIIQKNCDCCLNELLT